jgi:hypothetical protein
MAPFLFLGAGLFPASSLADKTPLSIPLTDRGYEWIKNKDGISVYKHTTSEIIKIGAEGRFEQTPEQLTKVLLDYRGQVGRIERLSESRVLARGDSWLVVYQRLNLPVISDRDYVLYVKWGQGDGMRWIRFKTVKDVAPSRKGIVRVTYHQGSWQIKALPHGKGSYVRFQSTIDLAGWLPKWLARSGAAKELPKLFRSIKQMARRSQLRSSL